MKIESMDKLLEDQLKDLYSAENQLLKALPKMVKAARSPELQEAFNAHLKETKVQVERLDQIAKILGSKLTGKKCAAMEGLVEEGSEVLDADAPDQILDLALIAAAQRVEHYEISAYGSALALAENLEKMDIAELLDQTLDEESSADEKLTAVATEIFAAFGGGSEEEGEDAGDDDLDDEDGETEEEDEASPRSKGRPSESRR